jgi:hypothetical protein
VYQISMTSGSKGRIAHYPIAPVLADHRGWAFGSFVKTPSGQPLSHAFEVKMQSLPKGASRDEWSSDPAGESVEFLMKGHFKFWFLIDDKEVVVEVRSGEAITWNNAIPHKWIALEDTEYVFVRTLR